MKCIILAGGFATRLWPLTENKAKPLLHLKDKPMVSHIVDKLPKDVEIIVSTNAAFQESFEQWRQNYLDRSIKIFVEDSMDEQFKKGALGATAMVIQEEGIEDDLLLLAGDNYFDFKMDQFLNTFKGQPLLAAYDIQNLEKARKFGVVVAQDGVVSEFQEKPEFPKSTLVSTGCFLFPKKNLEDIIHYAQEKNDDLGGVFEYLTQKGETIHAFSFDDLWFDVGSFEGYLNANRALLSDGVVKSEGVFTCENSQLIGGVYLGDHVSVKDSIIENSVILTNSKVENCVLRNCVIDENCQLSGIDLSYKMIRQGSVIKKD